MPSAGSSNHRSSRQAAALVPLVPRQLLPAQRLGRLGQRHQPSQRQQRQPPQAAALRRQTTRMQRLGRQRHLRRARSRSRRRRLCTAAEGYWLPAMDEPCLTFDLSLAARDSNRATWFGQRACRPSLHLPATDVPQNNPHTPSKQVTHSQALVCKGFGSVVPKLRAGANMGQRQGCAHCRRAAQGSLRPHPRAPLPSQAC